MAVQNKEQLAQIEKSNNMQRLNLEIKEIDKNTEEIASGAGEVLGSIEKGNREELADSSVEIIKQLIIFLKR
ncbi:MAG: hypothetical protein ACLFUK_08600 [Halanaerobium sp.]